jgi:ABC-type sulfate transport system substrate-binding protein
MDNSGMKVKGGVAGAKRVLNVIASSTDNKEAAECLKSLFLYELANEMRGSNRYRPEYEKRIAQFEELAFNSVQKASHETN